MTYKTLEKINRYCLNGKRGRALWEAELARRAMGHRFPFHAVYQQHHNPLFGVREPLDWIFYRYKPLWDWIDGKRFGRVLEVGCAHGLSTFFLTDVAEEVCGIDISPEMVQSSRILFPECKFSDEGFEEYFNNGAGQFDLIIDCYGPWGEDFRAMVFDHTGQWFHIGYRTRGLRDFLTWGNKLRGHHVGFEATLCRPGGGNSISPGYLRYFFTKRYLQHLKHSVTNGYMPQL